GYAVDAAETGEAGLELFSPQDHDLVITDLRMPGIGGMEVLRTVKQRAPDVPVLVITAYGNVDTAVEAMKAGAHDFIGKPFNRDHLLLTVERALESRQLRDEVRSLRSRAAGVERPLIVASAALRRVLEIGDRVAPTDASVLITGETGTGKELVARRVHARSRRSAGPFVTVNCAAIPAELIESELFGHERGAFTGAHKARQGRFRQAHQGSIFLDEVAELPAPLQSKLLRVLQESVVDVVGSDTPVSVAVRVIAATNQDLSERIAAGQFREDLLYRLNVVEIPVPPLRERTEEIAPLVQHFIGAFAPGRELTVPPRLLDELQARPWPGNVRQLQNACERLVILCPADELRVEDLPPAAPRTGSSAALADDEATIAAWPPLPDEGLGLVDLEKRVIERVLALKQGNVTQAAAYLRVPRHILAYRMAKYGLRRKS
ncbi:MAG: sigma-54-dependent Fis family transcriptional regulator, partial [Deltaproteobacteria bacterium]